MRWFTQAIGLGARDSILDVGGSAAFWNERSIANPTTLLNLSFPDELRTNPDFALVTGDGCTLPFRDRSFDVVFSNSVIEHVGTWERQKAFAAEARRVGGRLWVQTPAREFFIEPHLIAPFVHWLPRGAQRRLVRNFTVRGWLERPSPHEVDAILEELRLLTFAEMKTLFPDCTILRERFLGFTKSYIALRPAP